MVSSKFLTTLVKSFSAKLSFSLSLVASAKRNKQKRSDAEIKTTYNTELLYENNPKELTQRATHIISFTCSANCQSLIINTSNICKSIAKNTFTKYFKASEFISCYKKTYQSYIKSKITDWAFHPLQCAQDKKTADIHFQC